MPVATADEVVGGVGHLVRQRLHHLPIVVRKHEVDVERQLDDHPATEAERRDHLAEARDHPRAEAHGKVIRQKSRETLAIQVPVQASQEA